jgi:hypothetical protein
MHRSYLVAPLAQASALCLALALTGCSLNTTAAPTADAGLAIAGIVRGGQQTIAGAHLYLFAANSGVFTPNANGYGNASLSLLTSGAGTTLDSSGGATNGDYYVTTDSNGTFSISGDYSCTPNTQVYLYALGGNSGSGPNAAVGLLAVLGNCPSAGNFGTTTPYVVINEVSTIAAAYAFAGFATDATHVSSSGTALAQVGIQNAFANAANLAGISTGLALATTPAGNGAVPQSEINTLANALAACVNTNGAYSGPSSPTPCYTLFNDAQSGGSSGTIPSETATAAINIAHNPGANIAALYTLSTATPPFAPALTLQPNDFTVGLNFTGGGLATAVAGFYIAIDGSGNAWIVNGRTSTVTELSNLGAALSPSGGFTGGGLATPTGMAIDPSGNVWVSNDAGTTGITKLNGMTGAAISSSGGYTGGGLSGYANGVAVDGFGNVWVANNSSVSELNGSTGAPISGSSGYTGGGTNTHQSIAIDGSGNVWLPNTNNSISKVLGSSGVFFGTSGYTGGGLNFPVGIAIDGTGKPWLSNLFGSSISKFSSTGVAISSSAGYTGGGIYLPTGIAVDGAGAIWVADGGDDNTVSQITELNGTTGAGISPSTGYRGGGLGTPQSLAVDGSGDVWALNADSASVTEMIGTAAPVVTPLSVGVKNNALGTRP